MNLQLTLEWFDKKDEVLISEETSDNLEDGGTLIIKLGLPFDWRVYYGGYNVSEQWVAYLQPFFSHKIDVLKFDYQLVFRKINSDLTNNGCGTS